MQVSFTHQIHWKNAFYNSLEEYCAVLPKLFGKKVKHYRCPETKEGIAKKIAIKIAILLSHLTLIIPLAIYIGKAICRKVASLKITVPSENIHPDHVKTAKQIRKLREDTQYVPPECKDFRHGLRLEMPVDSIFDELCPDQNDREVIILGKTIKLPRLFHNVLSPELSGKKDQILAKGFNDFINVHGVEEAKGGIKNLLNMMIEGVVRAPYTGRLEEGMPEFVAGPHGPYYVILDPRYSSTAYRRKGLWKEDAVVAFLVPSHENRSFLDKGLTIAVERGFITKEEKKKALKKVITYDEFIALPARMRKWEFLLKAHLN